MIRFQILALAIFLSAGIGAVQRTDAERPNDAAVYVCVSILPQAYFVERVGGNHVSVDVLVGPGQSPATYDPLPQQMARLSKADVYFKIGVPFEARLLEKIAGVNKGLNIVDIRRGITLRHLDDHSGNDSEHHHEGMADPHIWLDPSLVKIQARTIADELMRIDPAHGHEYESNLAELEVDLDTLDSTVSLMLAPYQGAGFYVFHPSYGYFANRYGLRQVAVETGGREPGIRQLTLLIEQARRDNIQAVFIQQQFSAHAAQSIAREIGVPVVQLDPLAYDYLNNLRIMAEKIRYALDGAGARKITDHEADNEY